MVDGFKKKSLAFYTLLVRRKLQTLGLMKCFGFEYLV